ncbi:uncharacterized protein BO95DRAFT_481692 [Aspergillus brunneoviolaceus CBS 621.78]|uniref:Uncharacterized protein n=1 Tax=Aspergillus brunneoviolaceus CBS 621.78 TaxID=1450534 RepID=A0ACD1GAZ6_9EURO|nr:hypothetical protein BO95DRAFT_481692 [Aspergillus brunneoviolaceus CBS 621.78]RAH46294.1 hypothetical protein BO95DRAFT_481692 [Aspergillus brunneoviolaceus CBS 621.78]
MDRELLAIVYAIEKWITLLEVAPHIRVRTDHKNLETELKPTIINRRRNRRIHGASYAITPQSEHLRRKKNNSYSTTWNRTSDEVTYDQAQPNYHVESSGYQRRTRINYECVSILDQSTRKPRRLYMHRHQAQLSETEFYDMDGMRNTTSKRLTTTYGYYQKTYGKQHSGATSELLNIHKCLSDLSTY